MTVAFALMSPFVPIGQFTTGPTEITLGGTVEIGVVKQPHGVHTANTVKGNFELCQPFTVRSTYVLTCVLKRVPQGPSKAPVLGF